MSAAQPPQSDSPNSDQEFDPWLAELLEHILTEGDAALDAFCSAHPTLADQARQRVQRLRALGLFDQTDLPLDIGRYRLERQIGAGGMGVVYLAFDTSLCRHVALKTLPTQLAVDDRARTRFLREARAISGLRHEGIVPVYDIGDIRGVPYFTMELVDGRTLAIGLAELRRTVARPVLLTAAHLADALRVPRWRFPGDYYDNVARCVRVVAEALDVAHQRGITHRDIKPSNIIVALDGCTRLLDFGLARTSAESSLTMTGAFLGSPNYAAPEQLRGRHDLVDPRSDVYALGTVLYELLTLEVAVPGNSLEAVLQTLVADEPRAARAINPRVPSELETICLHAMEREPGQRYATARALADDLSRFLDRQAITASRPSALARTWRTVRRHPSRSVAAALALLILAGLPVLLTVQNMVVQREARQSAALAQALEDIVVGADYEELGPNAKAIDVLRAALSTIRARLRDYPDARARLTMRVGSVIGVAHIEEGREALREALALQRQVLPTDDPDLARTLNFLANAERQIGDREHARELYAEAIEILAANDHADADMVRGNLANLLVQLRRYNEAERLLIDLAARHPDEARHCVTLGWLMRDNGKIDAAREWSERAIQLTERNGEELPIARAGVYALAAKLARDAGDFATAETRIDTALANWRSALPDDSLMVALGLREKGQIAAARGDRGDTARARELLAQVVAIHERLGTAGDQHELTVALQSLARASDDEADGTVDRLNARAVDLLRAKCPGRERDLAVALLTWGQQRARLGLDDPTTRQVFEECAELGAAHFGADHPVPLLARIGLAECWRRSGDLTQSIESYEAVIPRALLSARQITPIGLVRALTGFAEASRERGDLDRAVELAARAMANAPTRSEEADDLAALRYLCARILSQRGQQQRATELLEDALQQERLATSLARAHRVSEHELAALARASTRDLGPVLEYWSRSSAGATDSVSSSPEASRSIPQGAQPGNQPPERR